MGAIDAEIDIAMVTWNTRETTLEALAALYAGTAGRIRVLVRDNASADGTAQAIATAFPQVELDAGPDNLGFAGGVNTILRRSTAPWVMLLNSDAWPEPGALEELVKCAERHPRAAAVAARLIHPDGSPEVSVWPFPSIRLTAAIARGRFDPLAGHNLERRADWAVGAAVLIRREALDELGGLDDSLFMYAEDLEWCWRAHDAGWQTWLAPAAIVRHIGNASGAQLYGASQPAAWIPNMIAVYRRHHGGLATWMWRAVNALAMALAARSARRSNDPGQAADLRLQSRAWAGMRSSAVRVP